MTIAVATQAVQTAFAEVQKAFDDLSAALVEAITEISSARKISTDNITNPETPAMLTPPVEPQAKEAQPESFMPPMTYEQAREVAGGYVKGGYQSQLKATLSAFGVSRLQELKDRFDAGETQVFTDFITAFEDAIDAGDTHA